MKKTVGMTNPTFDWLHGGFEVVQVVEEEFVGR